VSSPLHTDPAALEAVARELSALSDQLSGEGVVHESQPRVDQPSGQAVIAVTAAADHVVGECAANLLVFGERVAASARWYRTTDSDAAGAVAQTVQPR
jgi:hypothetical protein